MSERTKQAIVERERRTRGEPEPKPKRQPKQPVEEKDGAEGST